MKRYIRHTMKYFAKHQVFANSVHIAAGIGLGIMLSRPLAGEHPVRWGTALLIVALAGLGWAATRKS